MVQSTINKVNDESQNSKQTKRSSHLEKDELDNIDAKIKYMSENLQNL